MNIVKKLISNPKGMSLVTVIASLALGLGGISFLIKETLPKLQSEKKKIDSQLAYRLFISSVNDYIVHGVRERWCINYNNGTSDLLQSTDCSKMSMEEIVTYPGNLERVLWGADTIGTKLTSAPTIENANKILALNYLRKQAGKTTKELSYEDIAPKDGKLSFKITENVLRDMNEAHPLFIMSRKILECVNSVDVEVFQVKDFSNLASGDERKIGIRIATDIKKTKLSCMAVRNAESVSYYTFYPRRLHTYSLIKYGNLNGNLHNEFHGPVYVAGNFILPPEDADKEKTTIFYNSLTLATFNGGSKLNVVSPGQVVTSNGIPFTFEDRGHPYKSKQDSYPGFRGFLGGLKLEGVDKGLHNLFDHTSKTAVDISQLEACIEDNQSVLNKSKNASSQLHYEMTHNDPGATTIKLSFDKKNRFNSNDDMPRIYSTPEKSGKRYFDISTANTNDTQGVGEVHFFVQDKDWKNKSDENYKAGIGDNSSVKFKLEVEKFNLASKDLEKSLNSLKNIDRNNYNKAVTSELIKKTNIYKDFENSVKDLINKCNNKATSDCKILGYNVAPCSPGGPGGGNAGGSSGNNYGGGYNNSLDRGLGRDFYRVEEEEEEEVEDDDRGGRDIKTGATSGGCGGDYDQEINRLNHTKSQLEDYIAQLKDYQTKKEIDLEIKLEPVEQHNGQTVLNQRYLKFSFTPGWQQYFNLIYGELDRFEITFLPYHNGLDDALYLKMDLMKSSSGNDLRISKKVNNYSAELQDLKNKWSNARTNNNTHPAPAPLVALKCPQGMSLADWDLDMSDSANFAWNYANTPAGATVDTNDHQQADPIIFHPGTPPLEGHAYSTTKSVVEECIIPSDRTHVYGFYVCNKITINNRSKPLYMIGTFITQNLDIPASLKEPIHWMSIWDTKATDLIMTDLNSVKSSCNSIKDLTSKTWKDVVESANIAALVESCGPLDLVTNGPNNFSWTTIDPDIGIANPGDTMTSQKVSRIQKWIIREESRSDLIR